MAELKEKELKILSALSQLAEPARPSKIGEITGEKPIDVGRFLAELLKAGQAEKTDEERNLWRVTDKGAEYLSNLGKQPLSQQHVTETVPQGKPLPIVVTGKPEPLETTETIPSQSDIFRREGELLGVGGKKGEIHLDTIVSWVQRTANLNDLSSIWNALTEMNVANDVKKRWIKLYSQDLPGAELPPELKAKLEAGTEADKVTAEGAGTTKPKRFSVVNGQIIGDPEGDFSFKEALQNVAQEKGASPAQAAEMATTFAKMNTDTINLLIPIITKDKDSEGTTVTKLLLTQVENLQKEVREGKGASPELQAITQEISQLRETLHNEQLARIQEQNQATTKELLNLIGGLKAEIKAASEGKTADSKIGLMSQIIDKTTEELKGIRSDLKPLAQSLMERKTPLKERTAAEKAGFGTGLDKGIGKAHEASQLEDELFFTGGPASE